MRAENFARQINPAAPPLLRFAMPVLLFLAAAGLTAAVGYLAIASPAAESIGSVLYKTAYAAARITSFLLIGASFIFVLIGILDCGASHQDTSGKMLWALIILLAPILGALLWFALGRRFEKSRNPA